MLGIAPSIFLGRNDFQVREIIKTLYRALMMIHHTDKGGDQEAATEINQAWEDIQSAEGFRQAKIELLRSNRSRLAKSEESLLESEYANRFLLKATERLVMEKFSRQDDKEWLHLDYLDGRKLIVLDFLEASAAERWHLPSLGVSSIMQIEQDENGLALVDLQRRNLKPNEAAKDMPWVFGPKDGYRGVHYCFEPKPSTLRHLPHVRIVGSIAPNGFGNKKSDSDGVRDRFRLLLPSGQFSKSELDNIRTVSRGGKSKRYAPWWSSMATVESVLVGLNEVTGSFKFIRAASRLVANGRLIRKISRVAHRRTALFVALL